MANIKSQKKRILTNERRRLRNKAVRSELKTRIKLAQAELEQRNKRSMYVPARAQMRWP